MKHLSFFSPCAWFGTSQYFQQHKKKKITVFFSMIPTCSFGKLPLVMGLKRPLFRRSMQWIFESRPPITGAEADLEKYSSWYYAILRSGREILLLVSPSEEYNRSYSISESYLSPTPFFGSKIRSVQNLVHVICVIQWITWMALAEKKKDFYG